MKSAVAVEKYDKNLTNQADDAAPWLESSAVWEAASIDSLCFACSVEEQIGSSHDNVVDNAPSSDQVDQPSQHRAGAVAELQEGQAWEADDDTEAEDRHAVLGAFAKESWCATLKRKTVE